MGSIHILLAIIITFINISISQNISTTSVTTQDNETQQDEQQNVILDEPSTDTDTTAINENIISESDVDEMNGGGVWSSIGMIAVVICGCICLERLYSSCKKVYMKRTGRYGFSRLHNQTFNEFEEYDEELNKDLDDDDDDLMNERSLGDNITTNDNL